ncbi:MAG: family phosphatase [Flaviaesturariibacter sp.]|nr:family phosphatase [Flaviaesturariibacter sp.]
MKTVDTLIFDLGNVLIDWSPHHLYDKVFDDKEKKEYFLRNICPMEWHAQQDAGRPVQEATDEKVRENPDWAHPIRAFYARWKEMFQGPIEGSVDVLRELKESGRDRIYALTNWSAELFAQSIDDYPFLNWFDGRVVSGEEGINKPEAALYKILLDRYGIDPARALFIDDKEKNVEAGRALGIDGIVFTSPQQLRNELAIRKILP